MANAPTKYKDPNAGVAAHSTVALYLSALFLLANAVGCVASSPRTPLRSSREPTRSTSASILRIEVDLDGCDALFGAPGPLTGLDGGECRPSVSCGSDSWNAPAWTRANVEALRSWTLTNPPAELKTDPYDDEMQAMLPPPREGVVCAVVVEDRGSRRYRLETFASQEAAETFGAIVTHNGACGACSSLEDLAVYASKPDLVEPVRRCSMQNLTVRRNAVCIEDIGFTTACAQAWAYNARNTRASCFRECRRSRNSPYNDFDGSLNECLECDELESGPIFKRVAGRTRRNTGIPSTICRSASEVARLEHRYDAITF